MNNEIQQGQGESKEPRKLTERERFPGLVEAFQAAVIDRLAERAKENGGIYVPSTDALNAAALGAMQEVVESETEPVGPMLAIAVWTAVIKTNESAFRQVLERKEKAGTLGFKVGAARATPKSIAAGYLKGSEQE